MTRRTYRKGLRLLPILALAALAGCSTPPSPDTIAAVEVALTAAEKAATIYVQLPACPQPNKALCSDPAVSAKIKVADTAAYEGMKSMKTGTITPAAASALVAALVATVPEK